MILLSLSPKSVEDYVQGDDEHTGHDRQRYGTAPDGHLMQVRVGAIFLGRQGVDETAQLGVRLRLGELRDHDGDDDVGQEGDRGCEEGTALAG